MTNKRTLNKALLIFILIGIHIPSWALDPLASWNDVASKKAIIEFVEKTTKPGTPHFIDPKDRIATFDNDGTLWVEQPMYVQFAFALDRIKQLAPEHPEWKQKEPFASILKGDMKKALAEEHSIYQIVMATHAGMTTEEFKQIVTDWIATAKHPNTGCLYTQMVYKPMLEVLNYFRSHGFKTYIVSGGGVDFMRAWAEKAYGVPPEQVIGTSLKTKFDMRNGTPVLMRLPDVLLLSNYGGKPVAIDAYIGKRPVAAFGNSDGDLQMLEWTTAGKGDRLGVIIHHTDNVREWAYDRNCPIGRLDKALDDAKVKGWTVVDMKKDWNTIFPATS